MTISSVFLALILGAAFGFSLNKAGLTSYHNIANQFRFTDMTIIKFMMTAIVVAMIGLYIFRGLGWVTFPTVPATYIVGNLVGGLIFGVGMAGAGY
jgi:Sulphur transport